MRAARRQPRATPTSRQATFTRGMAQAYAALYSPEPVTPEQAAEIQHRLAMAPYQAPRQAEFLLQLGETPASNSAASAKRGTG